MTAIIVIVVASAALILGALWGIYWGLSKKTEGFLVALAGGALMVSAILELIEPATKKTPLYYTLGLVFLGALVFCILDYYVNKNSSGEGAGLLAAITLDGIPENLALGVGLIGASPIAVAALSGSIFLSNLPEAAGGAREMSKDKSNKKVLGLWVGTTLILAGSAIAGNLLLTDVPKEILAYIRCFAAGAIIGSLATEVFPKAFKEDNYTSGVATSIGVVLAIVLNSLG